MTGGPDRPRAGAAALAVVLALAGTTLTTMGLRSPGSPPAPMPPAEAAPAAPMSLSPIEAARPRFPAPAVPELRRSVPVYLDIPAIGVHTALIRLGLRDDGTVEVPPVDDAAAPAGWYKHSVTPGEVGAAVILGHVDSAYDGPAVFYRLGELRPGDAITIRRADGGTVRFTVTAAAAYPKSRFPTQTVYGPLAHAGLRLVTCGGTFDRARRSYRQNIVVSAELS